MTSRPAEKTLSRVLLISALDGWSFALIASLGLAVSLLLGHWIGVLVGGLIAAAGIMELKGRGRLARKDSRGADYLIASQVLIIVTMWGYSLVNLLTYNEANILAQFTPDARRLLGQYGLSVRDIQPVLKNAYFGLYLTIMGLTLLFQGGLALYYRNRKPAMIEAFTPARGNYQVPPLPTV